MAERSVIWRDQMAFINETQYISRVRSAEMELNRKMITVGGLGGIGDMEMPNGKYEAATMSVAFQSVSLTDVAMFSKNEGWVKLRLTGQLRMADSNTGTRVVDNAITRVHGYVKNPPVPGYQEDGSPYTAQISVMFLEIMDQTGRVFMVDYINGIVYPDDGPGAGGFTFTI